MLFRHVQPTKDALYHFGQVMGDTTLAIPC